MKYKSRDTWSCPYTCITTDKKALTHTDILNLLNEQDERIKELENSKKQLKRVYNYFMDYLEDEMSMDSFSEMWDLVITDEKWD